MSLNEALQWADLLAKGFKTGAPASVAIVFAAEVRRLQADVEALTTLCNDLEEFAQHDPGCDLLHGSGKCDRGLLSTLKRVEEL